jgi:hypothetical protein
MRTPDRQDARAPRPRAHARRAPLYVAILAAAFGNSAHAEPINYRFELEAVHSDNINLSEDNQASETVFIPRLAFDVRQEGASIELQARGEIERRHYMQNEFDDETRSQFAGQLNWSLLPQRLNLVVEDYLSEEAIDIRDGRYPGNLQQVNIFLGGPSFFARLGNATRFQLDVRGANSYAEVTPGFDSQRYSAAAALQRDLTSTSTASFNLTHMQVDFDDPTTTVDYTRQDGFIRYEGRLRKVEYQLDLGYSRLNRDSASDFSRSIARANVQWQINPQSRLRFRARHQFADAAQDLIVRQSDFDDELIPDLVDASSSLVTGGVYRQRDAELDYQYTGERVGLRLRPRDRHFSYIDNPGSDRDEQSFFYRVSYRLRPRMNVFFSGLWRERDFVNRDEVDIDHVYRIGIDHQWTRHWGWRAEAINNNRDSNLADPVYKENAVLLGLWWQR